MLWTFIFYFASIMAGFVALNGTHSAAKNRNPTALAFVVVAASLWAALAYYASH